MSKESYVRGFVKAAQAIGVDPVQLAKYAGWFGIGRKKTETFDPSQRKDLVAVSNDKGTFYVPPAWDPREPPTAWLKDTDHLGSSSGLSMFSPTKTIKDYGSAASTTNSPHATWREFYSSNRSDYHKPYSEISDHPYWKSAVLPDKSKAYVPASDEALQILKTMAGPAAQVRE